ncbi:uncharacterized protein BJ171DRAFT_574713 [Polychytrium aggregatum]|uniref:uncharacterized protein n=1 Tax=Polychytrium aggregatum TaxID=110093 RepID=UPI0022FEB0F4|nr:uncharacterized protein BJ171DRAFT_574713 [Polychytrium aggregatum]KAI9190682.1 hypothetical protein BJ171DRAFT_574713 [Polychytrium aggregatum]
MTHNIRFGDTQDRHTSVASGSTTPGTQSAIDDANIQSSIAAIEENLPEFFRVYNSKVETGSAHTALCMVDGMQKLFGKDAWALIMQRMNNMSPLAVLVYASNPSIFLLANMSQPPDSFIEIDPVSFLQRLAAVRNIAALRGNQPIVTVLGIIEDDYKYRVETQELFIREDLVAIERDDRLIHIHTRSKDHLLNRYYADIERTALAPKPRMPTLGLRVHRSHKKRTHAIDPVHLEGYNPGLEVLAHQALPTTSDESKFPGLLRSP